MTHTPTQFLICIDNTDYPVSLEVRKVYASLPDPDAEATGLVRVIDESGDDYLYPQSFFVPVELPQPAADCVLASDTPS